MKKLHFFLMAFASVAVLFNGCKGKEDIEEPTEDGTVVTLTEIVDAASAVYSAWEEEEKLPATFKVGAHDFSTPEYQFAICKALVNINAGDKGNITVLSYKPATNPDRDSYDKETIAVANGPKNGDETEDLVNVATRMLARMESDLQVPNQTNFTRNSSAIAFSTDRATITITRELASYKANGKLDSEVSVSFKGSGSSIKAFAREYVKILDVWEKNVGTIDRLSNWEPAEDGDSDVVENAHYVPNDYTITFGEKILTTADMLETAIRSYLLLRGYDGNDTDAIGFGTFAQVTPVSMSAVAPATHNYAWNTPLIETSNGGYLYKMVDGIETYGQVDPVILDNWAMRSLNFSFNNDLKFTNFCTYPREPITNYGGCFSSGRALLTYAFFFKYLLDNNIDKDIDKLDESIVIRSELFGIDTANNDKDVQLKDTELEFPCTEETKEAVFVAKKAWTAETSDSWITVTPTSGDAGAVTVTISVAANTGEAREGKVVIKGGNVTDGVEIAVKQAEYTAPNTATIKEFAEEFVKIIDIWNTTTGTIDQMKGEDYVGGSNLVENAHYVPSTTTITVGSKTYNTADMWELALRSYLLVRGYDGLDVKNYGAGKIPALADGAQAMSTTIVPDTHSFAWGAMPYNETGTYDVAGNKSTGNGGHLFKWDGEKEIHCQVDPLILDNWAMRSLNFTFNNNNQITNLCGYPRDPITNYYGAFSSARSLITYAFFFKYMLDHNLDKADGLGADVIIQSELFGDEEGSNIETPSTIKDFAEEYVKILDVWQKNIGTINRVSNWELAKEGDKDIVKDAHYIPNTTTITVGKKTYTTGDMLEVALRSYMLLRGVDGNDTKNAGWGNFASVTPVSFSTTKVPDAHDFVFGTPLIETSNGGYLYKNVGGKEVYCEVDPLILDNWAQRALNWPFTHDKTHSNFCGYPRDPINNYGGCFSAGRALITYAFFFKYMLDNNLDKADGLGADVAIRSELFGLDNRFTAQWEFSADAMKAYQDNFGGTAGIKDKAAGDGGLFVDSNVTGGGKITYVQVDKTSLDSGNNARRLVGGTGHPFVYGPWEGDYWLFTASNGNELPAGVTGHLKYITRVSASGPKYWVVEYLDGSEWKPAKELSSATEDETLKYNVMMADDGKTNVTVDVTVTTTVAMPSLQIRMRCASTRRADNGKALTAVNGGTCRIAGAAANDAGVTTSPVFEVIFK